jgi:hypothetical protein
MSTHHIESHTKTKTSSPLQSHPRTRPPAPGHSAAIIQRARAAPESLRAANVLQLQHTIGNRAVGQLLAEIGTIPSTGQHAPVQMLSATYYDAAIITYGPRAMAHMTQDQLLTYLFQYKNEIVVGQQQVILVGPGRVTGYAVRGNIIYNCSYDDRTNRHTIHVTHAHDQGRMG